MSIYSESQLLDILIQISQHMYKLLSTANFLLHKCAPVKIQLPIIYPSFSILLPILTPSRLHNFYHLYILYTAPITEGSIHLGLQLPQGVVKERVIHKHRGKHKEQTPHGSTAQLTLTIRRHKKVGGSRVFTYY